MADFVSLGIHRPSALPYLISESVLPENHSSKDYIWKVYPGPSDDSEDEVLYTSNCVVWSQDGHVRKVFNFDSAKQPVSHALITRFRNDPLAKTASTASKSANHVISYAANAYASRWGTKPQRDPRNLLSFKTGDANGFNRALVIILKSEMHIHYLSGSNYVLNVPFDIEKAFPAIDGVVVQRKATTITKEPPTPTIPAPPPNSFTSSQPYLFSQPRSPELRANRYRPSVLPPSPSTHFNLDALYQDLTKGPDPHMTDELPRFYSLENPLSDLAPVSHATVCRQPRFPRPGAPSGPIVEYDMLDPAEELVYVSAQDELAETAEHEDAPLFLLVTVNRELGQITVWQAWYLQPPKLSDLLSQRAAHQAAKAKRPSSAMTSRTAGASTPALKPRDHRDRVRESFAASTRLSVASTTRPSQDDEEVMASQMDPEYLLKKPSGGTRRVSSILSRGDVGNSDPSIKQTALGASFSGAGRRYPSMGSFTDRDRRSFGGNQGLRKSRASTPGSIFSKSIGPDDATEVESSRMQDYNDESESAERLIGATHRSAGTESVLGSSPDGLRKELVIRKLDVFMTDVSNFGSNAIEDLIKLTNGLDVEWEAMIIAIFAFAAGSIGRALRANHRSKSTVADGTRLGSYGSQLRSRNLKSDLDKLVSPAWGWLEKPTMNAKLSTITPRSRLRTPRSTHKTKKHPFSLVEYETMARHLLHDIAVDELDWLVSSEAASARYLCCTKIMLVLYLFREEQKLNSLSDDTEGIVAGSLDAIIAQFGQWLSLDMWSYKAGSYLETDGRFSDWELSSSMMNTTVKALHNTCPPPQSVFAWTEKNFVQGVSEQFLGIETIASLWTDTPPATPSRLAGEILPRLTSLRSLAARFSAIKASPSALVETMMDAKLGSGVFETLPEGVLAPLREAINRCQTAPPTTWSSALLEFVSREDLIGLSQLNKDASRPSSRGGPSNVLVPHDVQTIYSSADRAPITAKTHEAERHAVISLIFSEDRRFVDAAQLMNPTAVQVAECPPQPEWSEAEHLEQQKRVMQWVMVRTLALSPGDGMIHFESQRPLLSEKFHIKGFSTSCQMKPMDNTISADRSGFTEEKFAWTFFHAGVSAGLSISRNATGIDTSWIVFNKPTELNNRHAGFLLALGINGHLRTLAKWLAFKYLTPKHNMTSIGLLLGLSASYLGTMDTLLTRMLSVHITRMLPHGAAELNVSPSTQTAGLMGIGLVYYDTQHRRMSETMLSEVEHREIEDPGSIMDQLRDESYRLAAGFALGYINIGKGRDLRGLHGMNLLERLLTVAVGPRPVELVHVVDKATAGAVIAITLIYIKTGDQSVARKIDIPDTIAQLEHCRPDILLLRTVASHLIMWDEIADEPDWIRRNLPTEYAHRYYGKAATSSIEMTTLPQLRSKDVPVFNILTGLAWSLALRFAGSGNERARDQVIAILRAFIAVSKQDAFFYDAKLARATVKRCIDVLALAMATIMAGTGDLQSFRFLRSLHGRVDPETTYGSHLAAHLAIGTLFLGGGTYTFGTSNFAIASLLCAFYPLFPSDVLDNRVHLQALRHFWVFAAEPRCIVVQDIDTKRPIHVKLRVTTRDGRQHQMTSPCLLPELNTISHISTEDPTYWQVTLDFAANPKHLATFRRSQTVYVRRCPPGEASNSVFSTTLSALIDAQSSIGGRQMWEWILNLPAFKDFDQADFGLVLPSDPRSATHLDEKLTSVDSRLALTRSVDSAKADALWSLRLLFAWAQDAMDHGDGRLRWIGKHVVDMLRTRVAERTDSS
ncbi:hypothetical protein KCU92_g790, partial [Aureobasidium melanogenum]